MTFCSVFKEHFLSLSRGFSRWQLIIYQTINPMSIVFSKFFQLFLIYCFYHPYISEWQLIIYQITGLKSTLFLYFFTKYHQFFLSFSNLYFFTFVLNLLLFDLFFISLLSLLIILFLQYILLLYWILSTYFFIYINIMLYLIIIFTLVLNSKKASFWTPFIF